MLMTLNKFIQHKYAPGSRPTRRTVLRWIEDGTFPYRIERHGEHIYVDTGKPISRNKLVAEVVNG